MTRADVAHLARLKLRRAKQHLDRLEDLERSHLTSSNVFLVERFDTSTETKSFFTKIENDLPWDFGPVIGDAVHNMRSALDVLTYEILKDTCPEPRKIQFPISNGTTLGDLRGLYKNCQFALAPAAIRDAVEQVAPYGGGNSDFPMLSDLNNSDKHCTIIASVSFASVQHKDLIELLPSLSEALKMPFIGIRPESVISITREFGELTSLWISLGNLYDYEKPARLQPQYELVFSELPFSQGARAKQVFGRPVLSTLSRIFNSVDDAITTITAAI